MYVNIWLCDLSYTQQGVSAECIPAAIGGIATFCEAYVKHHLKMRLFKYPEKLIEAMAGEPPQIVGFSNYSFNLELSYGFAEVIKRKHPEITVVMGGPNYPLDPDSQRLFLQEHPMIDFYVFREGESPFAKLVEALIAHDFSINKVKSLGLDNVQAILEDGHFLAGELGDRLRDLDVIPSPYLAGKMDEFFDGKLMPILQTNRGCPFACSYCNEGNLYHSKVYRYSKQRIADEVDYIGQKMAKSRATGGRNDLMLADDNFGMFTEDLDTCKALARSKKIYGWPEYITAATGKNKIHRVLECIRLIDGAMRVTGSVQSTDQDVLKNIKRSNIDAQQLVHLAQQANTIGANSQGEIILGLPGDSVEKHFKSIEQLIDAGFLEVRVYQLMLLVGAEISSPGVRQRFGIKTHYRVIPRSFGSYEVDGETRVITAEVEEIATSQDTFTYQDYLHCRRFNLVVNIFYNDGVFYEVPKLLRGLGISCYEWLKTIFEYPLPRKLARHVENFIHETQNELWESREDLIAFAKKPENMDRFLDEELGGNLILKYKVLLLNDYLQELADVARTTVLKLIARKGKLTSQVKTAVKDCLTFEVLNKKDIWKGDYGVHYGTFKFDVERFMCSPDDTQISELFFPHKKKFSFYLTGKQIEVIERALNAYGQNLAGRARIFTRVHIKSLNREVSPIHFITPPVPKSCVTRSITRG